MPLSLEQLINGPGTVFYDAERPGNQGNRCAFEDRLNHANSGLSGAIKTFWTPVEKVSDGPVAIYNQDPPQPQPNWFSELIPYNSITKKYTIHPDFKTQYQTIQNKYYPNRAYATHPALDAIWYQPDSFYGSSRGQTRKGFRDPYYRPVIDINPSVPPFVNLYLHYKEVSDRLKGKSSLVSPEIPKTIETGVISVTMKKENTPPQDK